MSVQKTTSLSQSKEKSHQRVESIQTPIASEDGSDSDHQPIAHPGQRQDPPS